MINHHSKKKAKLTPVNILIGILFLLFLISLGLIVAINFRPLYYADIDWLGLENASGLSESTIRLNYDALIDYCSPFYFGELEFPTLPASASGISHFAEVKVIFNFFYLVGLISFLLLIILIIYKKKKGDFQYLITSAITMIILPLIVLIGSLINFDYAFHLFHRIVFRNDDWLFDPDTDPIITLLPQTFFMQCAFIIIAFVLIGSAVQLLLYFRLKKKNRRIPLISRRQNYYY